jgi:hypothetical protein
MKKITLLIFLLIVSSCKEKTKVIYITETIHENASIKDEFTSKGERTGSGGDLCGMRISEIKDDLKEWIKSGGSKFLTLPKKVKNIKAYNDLMLEAIKNTGNRFSCTDKKIYIGSTEKKCINQSI